VAGGAGYVGLTLTRRLLAAGWRVDVLDNLRHGVAPPPDVADHPGFTFVPGDLRDIAAVDQALEGRQAAILLAALVGEPACDAEPAATLQINLLGALNFFETARLRRVPRFVFASTDSCYGAREGEQLDEGSPLAPLSLYAQTKADMEREILGRTPQAGFAPTVLRLATVYGLAPRMRFDLALNLLMREAVLQGRVKIYSGEQWRPLIHVSDVASAFETVLNFPETVVAGQVFNVGSNAQNMQFKDVGNLISHLCPEAIIEYVPATPDLRDYYVKFDKIEKILGWKTKISMLEGLSELRDAIKSGQPPDPYAASWRNA
jgi:nucleoside-diphosphate-sugar epimerase